MIVDLSAPVGSSVNDSINSDHSSFRYVTVRQVAELITAGWFMAKLDLKSAYWKVPVHSVDSDFLAISGRRVKYGDRALQFGLRSAPIIFTAVADGLAWAMICSNILDLLDDFIFWALDAESCQRILSLAVDLADRLGLPVEPAEVEGPATTLTFLGIEMVSMEKLLRLKGVVRELCKLEVLIGLLSDTAKVVPAGRPFLRNLIDAKSSHLVSQGLATAAKLS